MQTVACVSVCSWRSNRSSLTCAQSQPIRVWSLGRGVAERLIWLYARRMEHASFAAPVPSRRVFLIDFFPSLISVSSWTVAQLLCFPCLFFLSVGVLVLVANFFLFLFLFLMVGPFKILLSLRLISSWLAGRLLPAGLEFEVNCVYFSLFLHLPCALALIGRLNRSFPFIIYHHTFSPIFTSAIILPPTDQGSIHSSS